jgi:hypothetical protein
MERIIEDVDRVRALRVALCEVGAKLGLPGAGLSFEDWIAAALRRASATRLLSTRHYRLLCFLDETTVGKTVGKTGSLI